MGQGPVGWLTCITEAAAEAGFVGIALMDHLLQIPQVGRAWDPLPDPYVTLGLLAGRVTDLTLGTLVTPVSFRVPGLIAKAVATLDLLSGGRAFCGIGAGWWEREHLTFGLPVPSARERLDRLEVAIETLRALWSPGTKAFAGQHVQLPEMTCYPRPTHDVPIIVGGAGSRTLRTAAATYARQHDAGTAQNHVDRYRGLAARGVSTVFLALPDLASADDVARCAPVVQALGR